MFKMQRSIMSSQVPASAGDVLPTMPAPQFTNVDSGLNEVYESLARRVLAPLSDKQKIELFKQIEMRFGTIQKFRLMMADKLLKQNIATGPVLKNYNAWAEGTFLYNLVALMRKDESVRNAVFRMLLGQYGEEFDSWAQRVLEKSIQSAKAKSIVQEVQNMLESAGGIEGLKTSFTSRGIKAPDINWRSGELKVPDTDASIQQAMPFLSGRSLSAKQNAMRQRVRKAILLLALNDLLKPDGELTKLREAVNRAFDNFKTPGNCTDVAVQLAKQNAMQYSSLLNYALSAAAEASQDDD